MKLAIVGSRTFEHYGLLCRYMKYCNVGRDGWIISGGAKGADALAKEYANYYFINYQEFPAEWEKHGKSAGFIRNKQIVDSCDMVLAFWDGKSKGTQDTINKAKVAKKPTFIVYF